MTDAKSLDAAIAEALKSERDGVAFYQRANHVAADPRVKQILARLARHREEDLRALEDAVAKAGLRPPAGGGHTPYPFEAVAKLVCYACGYVTEELPASCPSCGAARYAFEKEISKAMAWETAVAAGKAGVAALDAAGRHATGGLRAALDALLARERALLKEAEAELASAKA
ncbi:MAG TPA: hypothetical protein VII27_00785 [Thermoplasmata archaeon]